MSATATLLAFARAEHKPPRPARDATLRLLADTLAVGAAGAAPSAAVEEIARRWGEGGEARLLGTGGPMPAQSAAFVNGFRIHCLEWDAVHAGAVVHALSVVTAAVAAAIDRCGGCEPERALAAVAVGVDVASGLGLGCSGPMRFFRPATAGLIGAALAVARIEGSARYEDVLGFAYSQAAGTMQAHVEGSIALPLQIANAARAALVAVDLAKAGLAAPHDVLEGPFGYFRLFEEGELGRYVERIGDSWLVENVSTKPFPSGRASHAALGVIDELLRSGELKSDQIESIELLAPPLTRRLVDRPMRPDMSPSYARLCLPFLVALMLRDRRIDPRRFTAELFRSAELRDAADRVHVILNDNPDPNALEPQRLLIRLAGGRTVERQVEHSLGSPEAPLTPALADAKRQLARELAGTVPDPRIFDDPLAYLTEPR